jgi:hypothetical protein
LRVGRPVIGSGASFAQSHETPLKVDGLARPPAPTS